LLCSVILCFIELLDLMCAASRAVGPVGLLKSFPHVKEFIRCN